MSSDLFNTVHRAAIHRVQSTLGIPAEMRRALLRSDEGKSHLKMMCKTITERIKSEPNWVFIDQAKIELMVWSFTDWFVYAFKLKADGAAKSHLEQERIKAEATKYKELDNDGNGLIEELGVQVVDQKV